MKRSRSARSSRRRLPSFIDGILRSQMSERTYQTVQPKYVAACWILSRRASGETEETTDETDGTTSNDDIHAVLQDAHFRASPYARQSSLLNPRMTAPSTRIAGTSTKYIIPHLKISPTTCLPVAT